MLALPSSTRAAINDMVQSNGAPPDDIPHAVQDDESSTAAMDWVDEDDGGISAEGGELDDAVHAAHEHLIVL